MSSNKRFKFIINPEAGRGKSRKMDSILHSILKSKNVKFAIEKTKKASDAIDIARESAEQFDVVVAVGGDGTSNEVANGVIGSRASMGVIPTGSGNDFARMLGMTDGVERSVDAIIAGRTERIDSGTVRLKDSQKGERTRKFVNSIGIGFDAVVAYESQRIKGLQGVPLYFVSVLRSLKKLTPHSFELSFNGMETKEYYYLVCIGNGYAEGGGFYVTPKADPQDGMFEVCTVKQVSLLRALRILPTILKGRHGQFPEVSFFDTNEISVGSKRPFVVHCDGEILGIDNERAEVELNPKSLDVVVGSAGLQTFT
jgi:YegS/Rv2252/BmrU family lipid kinase